MGSGSSTGYELLGRSLESPLISAAGAINGTNVGEIVNQSTLLARTAIGGITIGSVTVPRQEGNEATYGGPVYHHDPNTGETYNSMGLPNIGLEELVRRAPEIITRIHEARDSMRGDPITLDVENAVVIFSGSPTNSPEHGDSVRQALHLANGLLDTDADLVEINVSCPNVVIDGGARKPILGYDLATMERLVQIFGNEFPGVDLGIKLPPYLTEEQRLLVPRIAELIKHSGVFSFVTVSNTIPNQVPRHSNGDPIFNKLPGNAGGMSGPATARIGEDQLAMWARELGGAIPIISSLGLSNGADLKRRLDLGATAGSGVTFLWESNDWGRAVSKLLTEFAVAQEN